MATATAMYHSGRNTLKRVRRTVLSEDESVDIVRGEKRRRLHKAFLRYHDPNNWPLLREALKTMGRADLIGNGKHHLIPTFQPMTDGTYQSARRKNSTAPDKAVARPQAASSGGRNAAAPVKGQLLTQHTGLPPRAGTGAKPGAKPMARPGNARPASSARPAQGKRGGAR